MKRSVLCDYQRVEEEPGRWRCTRCGQATSRRAHYEQPPRRTCPRVRDVAGHPCLFLGPYTGSTVACLTGCRGKRFKLYACLVHGQCLPHVADQGVNSCQTCSDYIPLGKDSP